MHRHSRRSIYRSNLHVAATVFIVLIPFLFLLTFSKFAHIATSRLLGDVGVSFVRLLSAYIIATVLGWILAASFYRGRRALIALPAFDILQSFPTFATLPLATLLFGKSNITIIFFLILTIIWPIIFSIISSLKIIRREWEEAAEIYQLRGFAFIKTFLWPASIPGLITGSIIGLGEGWEALIATEIIINAKEGLGNFFQTFAYSPTIVGFGILGFLLIIFSINKIIWLPLLEWSHKKFEE